MEPPARTVVIGDVGGHLDVLVESLELHGVDVTTSAVPPGLTVVQVGDMVHKGPDDAGVLVLVDRLLRARSRGAGRYVQLIGNHDAHYLGGPSVAHRRGVRTLDPASTHLLERLAADGLLQLAAAAPSSDGDVLLTHAGLTRDLWLALGRPSSASTAAATLNALPLTTARALRPGALTTGSPDPLAGVTDARTGVEVAPGWLTHGDAPFDQVHGHEGVWWWPTDAYHDDCPIPVRGASTIERTRRFSRVDLGEHYLLGVDWTLGEVRPPQHLEPLPFDALSSPLDGLTLVAP